MRIEYRANKSQREVRDSVGEALIRRGIATRVNEPDPVEEVAPKPKRRYKRRDIRPED